MADTIDDSGLGRYKSAADIPHIAELIQSLKGYKVLNTILRAGQNTETKKLEAELKGMIDSIDRFYDLLGDRNWILHDRLDFSKVQEIVNDTQDPQEAEERFMGLYTKDID